MLRLALMCAVSFTLGMTSSPSAAATSNTSSRTIHAKTLPALVAFADAWKKVKGYSATVAIFEQKAAQTKTVQNVVFDYRFSKPSSVTIHVLAGANTGARLVWEGGSTVLVRKGSGLLSLFKKTVSLHDPLVTTCRGSTVDQLSFGAILAHAQQPWALAENRGEVIDGVATDAVTLIPTYPNADANFTREVIFISTKTHLPTRVIAYEGSILARKIDFSNIRLTY